jgi:hypothetical protein
MRGGPASRAGGRAGRPLDRSLLVFCSKCGGGCVANGSKDLCDFVSGGLVT